jgi:hypothetical protein
MPPASIRLVAPSPQHQTARTHHCQWLVLVRARCSMRRTPLFIRGRFKGPSLQLCDLAALALRQSLEVRGLTDTTRGDKHSPYASLQSQHTHLSCERNLLVNNLPALLFPLAAPIAGPLAPAHGPRAQQRTPARPRRPGAAAARTHAPPLLQGDPCPCWRLLGQCWSAAGALLGHCWGTAGALLGHCWGTAGALLQHCCGTLTILRGWGTAGARLVT